MLCLIALTLAARPARAGHYSASLVSNGYSYTLFTQDNPYIVFLDDNGAEAIGGFDPWNSPGNLDNVCGGTITFQFDWQPDFPDDAPPRSAVVEEDSQATWDDGGTGSGSASDGLGDAAQPNPACISTGTRYSVQGGQTFQVSETPTATAGEALGGSANVDYSVTVTPVTIDPVGATQDDNGGWNILIGQKCQPTLQGIPCSVSDYQWSVTGTTFQRWVADASESLYIPTSSPLTGSAAYWFWNDQSQAAEKITCTATVTPPTGQGAAFTVTASQTVDVYVPVWQARGVGGEMLVGTAEPGTDGTSEWLYAAPVPDSGEPGGMTWYANVSSPANAPVTFGTGQLELVQIEVPGLSCTDYRDVNHLWSENGQTGLDTSYPYGWLGSDSPSFYTSFDTPGLNLTFTQAVTASVYDSFIDYLMYEPPNSTEYVPVAYFAWNTNGYAVIPQTGNWADFGQYNTAGGVNPSNLNGVGVPFTGQNAFPSWTQNVGNGIGQFNPPTANG